MAASRLRHQQGDRVSTAHRTSVLSGLSVEATYENFLNQREIRRGASCLPTRRELRGLRPGTLRVLRPLCFAEADVCLKRAL